MSKMELDRRSFLQSAGIASVGAIAGTAALNVRLASAEEAAGSVEWADEADVVIVGTGFAGLAAAVTLGTESPETSFVVLEAGSAEEVGGNSRCCGQVLHYIDDVDAAVTYLKACNANYTVKDEYIQAWAEGINANPDWLEEVTDAVIAPIEGDNAEFPEYPGADHVIQSAVDGHFNQYAEGTHGVKGGTLWLGLFDAFMGMGPVVHYDTRVIDFALNDATGEIIGVASEDGRMFKANKGVILACGGFACNEQMQHDFGTNGYPYIHSYGTPHNVGDGVRMAQSVGANLWHMNCIAGTQYRLATNADWPEHGGTLKTEQKDFIFIGPRGLRFMYEERTYKTRHGKIDLLGGGVYQLAPSFTPAWVVFGQNKFENELIAGDPYSWPSNIYDAKGFATNQEGLEQGLIVTADTLEELAEKMGLDSMYVGNFVETVNTYNDVYVANQNDEDYNRGSHYVDKALTQMGGTEIQPFELTRIDPPYYAAPIFPMCYNTQGGPERNEHSQVVKPDGTIIPRFYTAGELGAIYSNDYNGGGNVAECLRTGREAARHVVTLENWA